jgi:hypothetical protein
LLVLAAARLGRDLTTTEGLAVVGASFVPAYLSYRFVEEPARRAQWSRGSRPTLVVWGSLVTATVLGAVVLGTVEPAVVKTDGSLRNALAFSESHPRTIRTLGAGALRAHPRGDPAGAPHQDDSYYPRPEQLPDTSAACISLYSQDDVTTCSYGDPHASTRVVMAGDSHAVQWSRAMIRIAAASRWRLTFLAKQYCPLAPGVRINSPYVDSCSAWQEAAADQLLRHPPDLLVTSQEDYRTLDAHGQLTSVGDGFTEVGLAQRRLYRELIAAGTTVVVLRNTPHSGHDVGDCVTRHASDLRQCAVPRARAMRAVGEAQRISVEGLSGARLIDLDEAICPTRRCAPVIGSVLVFQDANHITTVYAESLAPRLAALLPGASTRVW